MPNSLIKTALSLSFTDMKRSNVIRVAFRTTANNSMLNAQCGSRIIGRWNL